MALTARGRRFKVEALNARGRVLLPALARVLSGLDAVAAIDTRVDVVDGEIRAPAGRFTEEDRSRQPSVFTLLRALVDFFFHEDEPHLGLYGAFGYDLAFQFEPVRLRLERPADQRDLVLYLPDELIVVDHRREVAQRRRYDFEVDGRATDGLPRDGAARAYTGVTEAPRAGDHAPGDYAALVRVARESFKRGDLFEVVPSQTFFAGARGRPPSCSGGCASGIRRPTDSSSTWARRSIWSARRPRCTCASTATAWRRARSPAPSRAGAIRSATPPRSWRCSPRPRTSRS